MYQPLFDRVSEWATAEAFRDEVTRARKDFFLRTGGEVFEDDKSAESRLTAFLEWYLFDRPLDGKGIPPVAAYLVENRDRLPPEEIPAFEGFTNTIHGIFELRRPAQKERLKVRELCRGTEYEVYERRQLAGLAKGDIFEARLIPSEGELLFSPAFCYHPREARKAILAEVKRRKKLGPIEPLPFIHQLSAMALKYERYRNVSVESLYSFAPPAGVAH